MVEVLAAMQRYPTGLQRRRKSVGRLPDQIAGRTALPHRPDQRLERLALWLASEDRADTAVERLQGRRGSADIGGFRVVHEDQTADLVDALESMGKAGE